MHNRATVTFTSAAFACASFLAVQPRAEAYCLLDSSDYLSNLGGPIPVRINWAGTNNSVGFVGLTDDPGSCPSAEDEVCSDSVDIMVEWVKVAIDEFNMASHGGPKLYYAGFTYPFNQNWSSYVAGITIESFMECDDQNAIQPGDPTKAVFALAQVAPGEQKARIKLIRGGPKACSDRVDDHAALIDYYWWVDPSDDDDDKSTNHDMVGTLVHELGHTLGLDHPDAETINGPGCANQNPTEAFGSIMYSSNKDFRRRLRKDDILGLREIYGEPARTLYAAKNTTSDASGSWGAQSSVGSLEVNTPPTASDEARDDGGWMLAAATNTSDELFYVIATEASVLASPVYPTTGSGTSGGPAVTYDPVAVAFGRRESDDDVRAAVAWLGGSASASTQEATNDQSNRVWWKVYDGSSWLTPQSTGLTRYKELGMSYDPVQDMFLLVYIDTWPNPNGNLEYPGDAWVYARTINASSGGGGCTQALTTAENVLHVGAPSCDVRSNDATRCHIPVVTTQQTQPVVRILEGTIDEHPSLANVYCWLRDAEPNPPPATTSLASYGPLWSAMDAATVNGTMLLSHVPELSSTSPSNTDYAELFTLARDNDGLVTGSPGNLVKMRSDYWPIAAGNIARTSSPTTVWWALTAY